MSTNLTGQDVDVKMGDLNIVFESMSLSIEDGRVASFSRGVPNGDLGGKYSAGGEISVDTTNLLLFIKAAKNVGAFNRLPKFDGIFNASTDDVELNVEAFGCLVKMSDVLDAAAEGGEKLMHKLPYIVCGKDFVHINGVPYIHSDLTKDLI